MLACDHENVNHISHTCKAFRRCFSGSSVLADDQDGDVYKPYINISTFGGNPLACKVAQLH